MTMLRISGSALIGAGMLLASAPAVARTEIHPFLEVQQIFSADLSGNNGFGNDTVTYTGVGAGVDATIDSDKLKAQLDYRYDHYFAETHHASDGEAHTGLGRLGYQVTPEFSLQAAGIATRTRGNFAENSPGLLLGDFNDTQQVYGVQAGPSYAGHFGDLNVAGDYRFGWARSNDGVGDFSLGAGQPALQNAFTDTSHTADASIGMDPHTALPFGWKASGGYVRDTVHFLDARYQGYFGRMDVTQPVSSTLALEAGAGYEKDKADQEQLLTDDTGTAILTSKGHLRGDSSKPRVLSYDQDGLIWDVGVLWRPSARTSLEVRGGQRYGQTVVTGSFTHKLTPTTTVQVVAYDDIQSFGRQLTDGIGALPTSFSSPIGFSPTLLNGCVFGASGGQGGCLNGLSSVSSNFYRSRGVYALLSGSHGRWTYGLGVDYDHRKYFAPDDGTAASTLAGVTDQSVTANGTLQRQMSEVSTLSGSVYVAWYDSKLAGFSDYTTYGGTLAYTRTFGRRFSGQAAVGVYSGTGGGFDQDVVGSAQLAVRYTL
jgi:hypothetical protein